MRVGDRVRIIDTNGLPPAARHIDPDQIYRIETVNDMSLTLVGLDCVLLKTRFKLAGGSVAQEGDVIAYLYERGSCVGKVRQGRWGRIRVYLHAFYFPNTTRTGEQYMGEFETFAGFQTTGSFGDVRYHEL